MFRSRHYQRFYPLIFIGIVWAAQVFAQATPEELAQLAAHHTNLGLCLNSSGRLGPIQKLVCESSPALLEAMNPGLKIPHCEDRSRGPELQSMASPVSAVFISCTAHNVKSCLNVAKAMLANSPGVTINVLAQDGLLGFRRGEIHPFVESLSKLTTESKKLGTPINVLPISSDDQPIYMRDPALLASNQNETHIKALPSTKYAGLGAQLFEQVAKMCSGNYRVDRIYAAFASIDPANLQLLETQTDPDEAERKIMPNIFPKEDFYANLGGNFIVLPEKTIVYGKNEKSAPTDHLITYLKNQGYSVAPIQLPIFPGDGSKADFHLDELINTAPSDDACGVKILRASTEATRTFLKGLPPDTVIYKTEWDQIPSSLSAAQQAVYAQRREEYVKYSKLLEARMRAKEPVSEEMINNYNRLLGLSMNGHPVTAGEMLADESLKKIWTAYEEVSERAANEIKRQMKAKNPNCEPKETTLPVLLDIKGKPISPNPVNGLSIGEKYYLPQQIRNLETTVSDRPLLVDGAIMSSAYDKKRRVLPELENFISAGLRTAGHQPVIVDTHDYNFGGGNLHCATVQKHLPCK